jgi:phage FluMu gp28-like protein
MRNVPYDQQKQVVFWTTKRLPRFSGGKLDATGNGAPLAQETKQKFGEGLIEEVKLSQAWYLEHMPPLKADFEDRTVAIVRHPDLIDDMRQVRLIRGVPMVPKDARTKGEDGLQRHGDFAPALALARAASRSDVRTYGGYEGLKASRPLDERGGDDEADDRDGGYRLRDGGAW